MIDNMVIAYIKLKEVEKIIQKYKSTNQLDDKQKNETIKICIS